MKESISSFLKSLDIVLETNTPNLIVKPNNCFSELINNNSDDLDLNKKIELLYCFSIIEKIYVFCEETNFHLAKYWIDSLNKYETKLSETATNILKASYYPMLSNYYFGQKKFKEAQTELNKSFKYLDLLEKEGENVSACIIELKLNNFKITKSIDHQHKFEKDINAFFKLIFSIDSCSPVKLNYYIETALTLLSEELAIENPLEKEYLTIFFKDIIFKNDISKENSGIYNPIILAFQTYNNNDDIGFCKNVTDSLVNFHKISPILQRLLLERMKIINRKYFPKYQIQIDDKIDSYYSKCLIEKTKKTIEHKNQVLGYIK